MSYIYAISDIHGYDEILQETLEIINLSMNKNNKLIFCGDYIDYGADSLRTLCKIKELTEAYPTQVFALMGNHEEMFLTYLSCPQNDIWNYEWLKADRDFNTIKSFVSQDVMDKLWHKRQECNDDYSFFREASKEIKADMMKNHAELIRWLKQLPYFYETEQQIFVHAGIDEEAGEYWKWGCENNYFCSKYPHTTGAFDKDIIAGHIGTCTMGDDKNNHQVFWDKQSHFYIDGTTKVSQFIPVLKYDITRKQYTSFEKIVQSDGSFVWREYQIK